MFCKDTATTEIYTLSLHDALPIYRGGDGAGVRRRACLAAGRGAAPVGRHRDLSRRLPGRRPRPAEARPVPADPDRKSTRLNSSHANISYVVLCLIKTQVQAHRVAL